MWRIIGGMQNEFKEDNATRPARRFYLLPLSRPDGALLLSLTHRFVEEYVARHSKSDQPLTEAEVLGRYAEFVLQRAETQCFAALA